MLQIEHLTKRYGEHTAVDDLSLTIGDGEICAFIGHNGAGKTTTLKACVGLLAPDGGTVTVEGIDVCRDPLGAKRMMAYIPDNPDLYEFLSGIRYLNFIADVFGVDSATRTERIKTLGDRFDLTSHLAEPIGTYSHGMKQKLAIIAAFLHAPRIILMDEPFVGLDPMAAHILKDMMREHCAAGGSIFFSTHVLDVAEKLCDKVAIIRAGKLLVSGSMDEVRGNSSLEEVFLELEEDEE